MISLLFASKTNMVILQLGLLCLFAQSCLGQLSSGVNLGTRRVPQIAPPRVQSQQPNTIRQPHVQPQQPNTNRQPQQQPGQVYGQPYQPPNNFHNPNNAMLARRLNLLETQMRRMSGSMGAMGDSLRVTLSATLTDRLGLIRQEVDTFSDNISQAKEKLNQVAQEVKYLKNSNANMQKRLNQIESKQSQQQESIESFTDMLGNMNDFALPPDGAEAKDYQEYGGDAARLPLMNQTQVTKIISSVETLKRRMNATDTLINNHDQDILRLGFEFNNIRQKSEFLQGENSKTSQTLNNLNNVMSQMQFQVEAINEDVAASRSSDGQRIVIDGLTSSLDDLRNDVIRVEREQGVQQSSIQNLTTSLNTATSNFGSLNDRPNPSPVNDYYGNDGDTSDDSMMLNLVQTVSDLEETVKQMGENEQIEFGELSMKVIKLDITIRNQEQQTNSVRTTVNDLQQDTMKLKEGLRWINTTVQQHDSVINEVVPEDYPDVFPSYSFESPDNFSPNGTDQIFQPQAFDVDAKIKSLEDSTRETIGLQNTRLQVFSDRIATLEGRLQASDLLKEESNGRTYSDSAIEAVIEAMNSSIVIQSGMLNQGIKEIGNYNQRLRRNEARDETRDRKLAKVSGLLENTTITLSEMSLQVAEHQLTIPSIFDSLNMGDNILLDLSDQIYQQQVNIEALNMTLLAMNTDNNPPLQSTNINSYVTDTDFSALAAALAGVAMRIDATSENLEIFKNKTNTFLKSKTNTNQDDDSEVLQTLTTQIELVNRKCSLSQFAIQHLSLTSDNLTQEINSIQTTLSSLPINASELIYLSNEMKLSQETSNLLDKSMRKLVTNSNDHRRWIISLRKRIRNLEGLKLKTCAHMSDVTSINTTLSDQLSTLNNVVENMSPLCEDKKLSLNELGDADINGELLPEVSNEDRTNNVSHLTKMLNELKTVPLSIRLLDTQVHSLQESMQTLPQLNARVETLNSMRNLVFKNAQDVSSFHESVADLESSIRDLVVSLDSVQFKHNRLDSYHHDLRSQVNDTKKDIDKSNDEIVKLSSIAGLLSRHFNGNVTEIKDSLLGLTGNLQAKSQILETLSQNLEDIDNYFKQNSVQNQLRIKAVDSQLATNKRNVQDTKSHLQRHDNEIELIVQSSNEAKNGQRNKFGEVNTKLLQLETLTSGLDQKVDDIKMKSTQTQDQLANLNNQQLTTSGELNDLVRSNSATQNEIRRINAEVINVQSDVGLHDTKINNIQDEISEVANLGSTHGANIMSLRQSFLTANDEINNLQQAVQRHDLFLRKTDQTMEKHKFDIAFILAHSSNHSVAIDRIKQTIDINFEDSITNTTQEMLDEMRLIDEDLRNVKDEMIFVKRQSTTRDNNAAQLELQITEISTNFIEQGNKVRTNRESLEILKGEMNRQKNKVRELEHVSYEQRTFNEDLQQVVLTNRNDLVSLNNLPSTMEQSRLNFVKVISRQENQTRAIKLAQDQQGNEISRLLTSMSEQDRTLNNMQQDRFSLEGDIEQIYQSSRNLENLLRTTVTQLNDLRKDFEDSMRNVLNAQKLEKKTTKLQESVRNSVQAMNSNENKISRIQGTIEQIGASVTDITNSLHSRDQVDRSRIAESRDLRNKIDRTSILIRNLQRDLRNNNDRLRSLIHYQSTNTYVETAPKRTTLNDGKLEKELEASGWMTEEGVEKTEIKSHDNQEDTKQFLDNLNSLSNEVFKLNEAMSEIKQNSVDQKILQNITTDQVTQALAFSSQNLQRSEEINTSLLSMITSLELDVIKLTNQVNEPADFNEIISSLSKNIEQSNSNALNAMKLAENSDLIVSNFTNQIEKQLEKYEIARIGYQQNVETKMFQTISNLNLTLNYIMSNLSVTEKRKFDNLHMQIVALLNNKNQQYLQNIEAINSTLDMVLSNLEQNSDEAIDVTALRIIQSSIRANFSELRQQINDVISQFDILFELMNNLEETTYQLQDRVNDNNDVNDLNNQITHLSHILNDIQIRIENLDQSSNHLHHRNSKQIATNIATTLTNKNAIERILLVLNENAINIAEQGETINSINTTLSHLDMSNTPQSSKNTVKDGHHSISRRMSAIINTLTYKLNQVEEASHITINKSIASFKPPMAISYSYLPEAVESDGNDNYYYAEEINGFKEGDDQTQDNENLIKDTNENLINLVSIFTNVVDEISTVLTTNYNDVNNKQLDDGNYEKVEEMEERNDNSILNEAISSLGARIQYLEDEPSLPPELFYELITNMTTLSANMRVLSLDKLAEFGRNKNVTAELRKDLSSLSNRFNNLKTKSVENSVTKLLQDFAALHQTVMSLSESQDFQELTISNMYRTQASNGQKIRECKQGLQNLTTEYKHFETTTKEQISNNKNLISEQSNKILLLDDQLIQISAKSLRDQQSMMSDVFAAMNQISDLNYTIETLGNYMSDIQQEFQVQISGVDINEVLRRTLDQHEEQINEFNEKQMEQETVLTDFENTNKQLTNDMELIRHDVSRVNHTAHKLHSSAKAKLMTVVDRANSVHFRIEQSLDQHDLQISSLREITNAIGQRVASEIGELAIQLGNVNVTLKNNQRELVQLRSDTEGMAASSQNVHAVLMRHAMEQKGFSRSIQAAENLLQTMLETVSMHSNQITFLTGEIITAPDKYKHTISFLTEIVSNHSIDLMNLYDKMSLLSSKVRNPTSVRVIVPPSGPIRIPEQSISTTPTTTTTTTDSTLSKPARPSGLTVTSSTHNELTLTWSVVSGVNEYRLVIQNINGSPQITREMVVPHPPVTIHGLNPNTRYLLTIFSAVGQQLSQPHNAIASTSSQPITTTSITTTMTTQQPTSSTFDPNEIIPGLDFIANHDSAEVVSCDFDYDLCGFSDSASDDFDWIRRNGSTPSAETGPSKDHTQGSDQGHYMFIESSRPRRAGDIAQLISPNLVTPNVCVDFYYHMFGSGTGSLNVLIGSSDGLSSRKLWGKSGQLGDQWKHAEISVASSGEYNIIFEAVRGSDYHGDTAIDDIVIKPGDCPQPLISCGFETPELCGFVQEIDDEFNWTQQKGATSSADTGPIADHTLGNADGYYMYMEASNPRSNGDTTRLSSSSLPATSGQCLQFYYHMHGVDTGSLNVYLRQDSSPNDLGTAIWNKDGPQGNDWIMGRVSLVSINSFKLVFEGVRGADYHGDIALDDITIIGGLCENPVCPVGVRYLDQCYKVEKDGKSYQDASAHCQASGGLLAAIKTQEQQDFIVNLLSNEGNRWTLFWIGLDDLATEGEFRYSDGALLDLSPSAFGAWTDNEPNDALGDEDCVNMEYSSKNRRWNDVPCDRELWFICQYQVTA